jgi:TPR repeat protein
MYFNGENVNKDVIKAFDLYKSSSDFGHPRAMYNLANMHYSGVGTVKDLKMAYKMFLKSKIHGIEESNSFLKKISNVLKPEELALLNKEFESLIEKKIVLPVAAKIE